VHRPPDVETHEDFQQYYRGAYIGYRNQKGDPPFLPMYVAGADGRGMFVLNKPDGQQEAFTFDNILVNGQFGTPQYGSVEVRQTAFYVARRSSRTAHRGHRAEFLNAHVFHPDIYPMGGKRGLIDPEYLTNLFNPQYRGLDEAYALLMKGERRACSLNRAFTMCLDEGYKVPTLYHKTQLVGYFPGPMQVDLEDPNAHRVLVMETFSGIRVNYD